MFICSHNFAYFGNMSGVNFIAAYILQLLIKYFPVIFIFPYMNAYYGFNVPEAIAIKSSSKIEKVASTFSLLPLVIDPEPFFKSNVQ